MFRLLSWFQDVVQLAHRLKIPNGREIIAEYLNKQNEQLMNGHSAKVNKTTVFKSTRTRFQSNSYLF